MLSGSTFRNIKDRGDYDTVANSTMMLDELEQWFAPEITRYRAERGRAIQDENLFFAVIEEQRALVNAVAAKTREARRLAERRDRALTSVESSAIEENDPEHAESGDILDLPTFKVEEWS